MYQDTGRGSSYPVKTQKKECRFSTRVFRLPKFLLACSLGGETFSLESKFRSTPGGPRPNQKGGADLMEAAPDFYGSSALHDVGLPSPECFTTVWRRKGTARILSWPRGTWKSSVPSKARSNVPTQTKTLYRNVQGSRGGKWVQSEKVSEVLYEHFPFSLSAVKE